MSLVTRTGIWAVMIISMVGLSIVVGFVSQVNADTPSIPKMDNASLTKFKEEYLVNVNKKCGGVMLDNIRVLTAAHCVSLSRKKFGEKNLDPQQLDLIEVSIEEMSVGVIEVNIHPDYDSDNPEGSFDLAVLTLDQPLLSVKSISGIDSISASKDKTILFLGRNSGPRVVDLAECPANLGGIFYNYRSDWFQCVNHVALEQSGTCVGDSGSPIIAISENGLVSLLTIHHAAHTLSETPIDGCRRGGDPHQYGVAIMASSAEGWLDLK